MYNDQQKTQNLRVPGPQFICDMINLNNKGANLAPADVTIGVPVKSADERYNTDLVVTIPNGAETADVEYHYQRFDLGEVLSRRELIFPANGISYVNDIAAKISETLAIEFDADDLINSAVEPTSFPHVVVVKAAPSSLRFVGQFSVELTKADDRTALTAVAVTNNVTLSDSLEHRLSNDRTSYQLATNGEISIGLSFGTSSSEQILNPATAFADGKVTLNLGQQDTWYISPFLSLVSLNNGAALNEQYDVELTIEAAGREPLVMTGSYAGGRYRFNSTESGMYIRSGTSTVSQHIDFFETSRLVTPLELTNVNSNESPLGDFVVKLKATRVVGGDVVELSIPVLAQLAA